MATIYAHTNDGYVVRANESTWAAARDQTGGTSKSSTVTSSAFAMRADRGAARGGGYVYTVQRSFLYFDTSGISSTVDSATLNIFGTSNGGGDVIVVKSDSDIDTLDLVDFDAIVGWSNLGVDNQPNVTMYSNEVTTWSTSGYNSITLAAGALSDMEDDDALYVCIMNYDYDLRNVTPTGHTAHRNGMWYTDYTGTSRDPYVDYTLAAVTAADNAVFFGTNF